MEGFGSVVPFLGHVSVYDGRAKRISCSLSWRAAAALGVVLVPEICKNRQKLAKRNHALFVRESGVGGETAGMIRDWRRGA